MKVVVVASGDPAPGDAEQLADADFVIAADGGAGWLDHAGRRADLLVGDLDSIDADLLDRLRAAGTPIESHPAAKDASDVELAVARALGMGAEDVVLLGAIGGQRLDHQLANLLLLAEPGSVGRVRIVHGPIRMRVLHDRERLVLAGQPGDTVSLLPIGGDAIGVVTGGLRFPLAGEALRLGSTRGLSNEIVAAPAEVGVERGSLLVLEQEKGEER